MDGYQVCRRTVRVVASSNRLDAYGTVTTTPQVDSSTTVGLAKFGRDSSVENEATSQHLRHWQSSAS